MSGSSAKTWEARRCPGSKTAALSRVPRADGYHFRSALCPHCGKRVGVYLSGEVYVHLTMSDQEQALRERAVRAFCRDLVKLPPGSWSKVVLPIAHMPE